MEKTVKHLQDLQRQQSVLSQASDPSVINKFKAGFTECANEVGRFAGIEPIVKRRLLQHLSNCLNGVKTSDPHHQVHILPSPPSSPEQNQSSQHSESSNPPQSVTTTTTTNHITLSSNGYFLMNGNGNVGVQLIPTKLTNGNIAFVIPHQTTPLPMLIPIPNRNSSSTTTTVSSPNLLSRSISSTNSNSSSSSSVSDRGSETPISNYGPMSPNVEPMDCQPSPPQAPSLLSQISPPTSPQQQVPQSVIVRTVRINPNSFSENAVVSQKITSRSPSCHSPVPLSLVMKKPYDRTISASPSSSIHEAEDKPWRPW